MVRMKRILPVLILIAACSSSAPDNRQTPQQQAPLKAGNYSGDVGPSPVGVIPTAMLHDAQRNKDVEISLDYPTRGGPFPVIIFSHGYGSSDQAYEPLISYWTSYGYVCIRPKHADAGALRDLRRDTLMPPPGEERGRPQQRRRGTQPQQSTTPPTPPRNRMEDIWTTEREPQWRDRAADVKLVIDSLNELERLFPELQGKMDHARIGVSGHSYGAFTALLVAGMRTFSNPALQLADPRVRAAVIMSPPGVAANRGTTAQSWTDLRIPVMFMTGTNDRGVGESEDANWRKQSFDNSPAGDKYFLLITGAGHLSFTGASLPFTEYQTQTVQTTQTDPYGRPVIVPQTVQQPRTVGVVSERRIFQIVKITSLAFWDAYLKSDTSARELIQPAKFESSIGGGTMSVK